MVKNVAEAIKNRPKIKQERAEIMKTRLENFFSLSFVEAKEEGRKKTEKFVIKSLSFSAFIYKFSNRHCVRFRVFIMMMISVSGYYECQIWDYQKASLAICYAFSQPN